LRVGRNAVFCAATVLAFSFQSCPSDDATVLVSWRFGPARLGCGEAGVQTVHVFVGPLAPTGSYDHEVECGVGEDGLEVSGVEPGRHVLVVKGLARDRVLFALETEVDVEEGGDLGIVVVPPYTPP
jgi:hypothetical protein